MGVIQSYIADALEDLKKAFLYRSLRVIEEVRGPRVKLDGREVLCFCSNDYLGLAQRPELAEAAAAAAKESGWGAGASRLLSGTTAWHARLEERIARYKRAEAALYFPTGYMANLGLISAVTDAGTLVLADRLNHASLMDACRLSRGAFRVYPHCDVDGVIKLLRRRKNAKRTIILTESVFSMDGDVAPLRELQGLATYHGADLIVDDAHANGIFGPSGRGALEMFGLEDSVLFQVATLSKAAGSIGGFVAGNAEAIDYLRTRARTFIYTTAPPPPVCAAGIAALDLLEKADAERRKLWDNVRFLQEGFRKMGADLLNSASPILPVVLGDNRRALSAAEKLWEQGFLIPAIRPPTVPEGTSRLRISVSSLHEKEHLESLLDALRKL